MRCIAVAISALLLLQLANGQKELAGAYIEGSDWCPNSAKQAPAAPPPQQGALARAFSRKDSKPAAPAPAPVCKLPYKYCGPVATLLQRCKTTMGCKAVSYDGRCGFLKTAAGPRKARTGWSTYIVA